MIDSRLVLCAFSALMTTIIAIRFIGALRRLSWDAPPPSGEGIRRRLSVIIPARDEELDLGESLASVLDQDRVELDVIVINDHSSDRTGEIADRMAIGDPRLRVLHNPELPPGWLGKCNAMQKAAALASGEVLLFTDADIVHDRACFATALDEIERRSLDFLSLFPLMRFVSLWENAILPALTGGIALVATSGIEDPDSPDAFGAGAFLMVRRSVFMAVGGFETIRGEMLDDVELARLIKRNGYRVGFHAAPRLVQVRLYKGNRHAFWGMTKNILVGLQGRFWLAPAVMLLPVLVFGTPLVCIVCGAWEGDAVLVAAGAATYTLQYATIWIGRRVFSFHPAKALLFPLVTIPVILCMTRALYLYSRRGAVSWRGRTVRVRDGHAGF